MTTTCCQIDILRLFHGGFSTGHGFLREPNSIGSYAALAAIAIQSNQNDQHGGQSIPNFDYGMAEGVGKTFARADRKKLAESLEDVLETENEADIVNQMVDKAVTELDQQPRLETNAEEFDRIVSDVLIASGRVDEHAARAGGHRPPPRLEADRPEYLPGHGGLCA